MGPVLPRNTCTSWPKLTDNNKIPGVLQGKEFISTVLNPNSLLATTTETEST